MKYPVLCHWQMSSVVYVDAESMEQAVDEMIRGPLPDGDYVADSFEAEPAEIDHHSLRVNSLRDANAECTCGRWHYTATTSDHDTDGQIQSMIADQFRMHVTHSKGARPDAADIAYEDQCAARCGPGL